ncbi:MAG: hypothetical protein R2754_07555 [Microthrixaceae bacterium]
MASHRIRNWAVGAACVVGLSACHPVSGCGIGPLSAGMAKDDAVAAGWAFDEAHPGSECGFYINPSAADAHVIGTGSTTKVAWAETADPTDRLDNGIGVGSTFAELKAAYPGKLLDVHILSAFQDPGSLALYQPVAIVKVGGNAITFKLEAPLGQPVAHYRKVERVKVSTWAARGDDEGCS